ncbi:Aste57867_2154 [Aphanomyces stellatus]|uniref:Dynein light chain n=1 Tax=Aphanomyces stellatus TaxID=120398 RepID=A0A485K9X1_9STRA|nr:hypothetical protein As57867_002149 [Aphanomyces stellatus]KAF0718049.1 hypothetical protein As57867_001925 [Aphanomyces stellatus]KAF0718059.1 hypothetical protein As57867_001935 [Aphanomyces stellatus]VFT79132.1 Aste57867_1927 [Aphanomyces stellatus]VFT79142.1 Aste57867_1937 [Aphanomyces stellatus]
MSKAVKKDDVTVGALRIVHKDSSKEMEDLIVNSATNALKAYYKGEKNHFTEVAQQIKKELEDANDGCWHVVVGKSFGSFVTHEVKKMVYFFLGQIGFLVFRHG